MNMDHWRKLETWKETCLFVALFPINPTLNVKASNLGLCGETPLTNMSCDTPLLKTKTSNRRNIWMLEYRSYLVVPLIDWNCNSAVKSEEVCLKKMDLIFKVSEPVIASIFKGCSDEWQNLSVLTQSMADSSRFIFRYFAIFYAILT